MHVSVPWIVTNLNLINNICFVQLSLHPKSIAERIPLILRVPFVHFEWSKGFWIAVGLTVEAVVWAVWPLGRVQAGRSVSLLSTGSCPWDPTGWAGPGLDGTCWQVAFYFLWAHCLRPWHVLHSQSPDTLWGWDAAFCKCRRLMSLVCCEVRTVKPGKAGLELLPQEGWVFCSSQGLSVNPVQMSPNISGQVKWH